MKPKASPNKNLSISLIQVELTSMISMEHELVKLSEVIDWESLETHFDAFFSDTGRTAISTRLMIALNYLKYMNNMSDDDLLANWVENPYWQYFSGMKYFQHKLPIHPTTMTKWRQRIAKEGAEELLKETIKAGLKLRVLTQSEIKDVNVDTTVQEKNIRFPTDARLYQRALTKLVEVAKKTGIVLRQSYTRVSKKLLKEQQRFSHSRKFQQAKKCTAKLKTLLGRVIREFDRSPDKIHNNTLNLLSICKQIYTQQKLDKNKIYSIHEPNVRCIAKGKVHKKYEFGSKVSITSTNKSNFIIGALAFLDNPHDGKTLLPVLEQAENFGLNIENVFVDQGYKGHGVKEQTVHICKNQKRKVSKKIWKQIKRRAAVEPIIGHLKSDYRLAYNKLSGNIGDTVNLLLSCCAFNLKKLLKKIKEEVFLFFCLLFFCNFVLREDS